MYNLKPYYATDMKIVPPNLMYHMKNFHEDSELYEKRGDCAHSVVCEEAVNLLEQQKDIIRKLQSLEETVKEMLSLPGRDSTAQHMSTTSCVKKPAAAVAVSSTSSADTTLLPSHGTLQVGSSGAVVDVVIQCEPGHPPLSIFMLCDLLTRSGACACNMHLHSSVTRPPHTLRDLITAHNDSHTRMRRSQLRLILTVIWRKDECGSHQPVMLIAPHRQAAVRGEANIVRFLHSLLLPQPDCGGSGGEGLVQCTRVNSWLDLATSHLLLASVSPRQNQCIDMLEGAVSKTSQWILPGAEPTLADMLVYSAIRQRKLSLANTRWTAMEKWFGRCKQKFAGYSLASRVEKMLNN